MAVARTSRGRFVGVKEKVRRDKFSGRESSINHEEIEDVQDENDAPWKMGRRIVELGHLPEQLQSCTMHEAITPLAWLLGRWKAEDGGVAKYPTMETFKYGEEVEFFHVQQPNVQFSLYSWHAETKQPLHREVGFIKIKPGTNKIAIMSAHNFGVADIQEGEVTVNELKAETSGISRASFAKDPATKRISRTFRRNGDELEQVLYMETTTTPLTEHLRVTYKKVA